MNTRELPQGTLDLPIWQALALEPLHFWCSLSTAAGQALDLT